MTIICQLSDVSPPELPTGPCLCTDIENNGRSAQASCCGTGKESGCKQQRRPASFRPDSGRSVAWLARLFRVQEVVSSNLTAPTILLSQVSAHPKCSKSSSFLCVVQNRIVRLRRKFSPLNCRRDSEHHF